MADIELLRETGRLPISALRMLKFVVQPKACNVFRNQSSIAARNSFLLTRPSFGSEPKAVKETESLIWLLGLGKRVGAFSLAD